MTTTAPQKPTKDSTRTAESKRRSIERKAIRVQYTKNGGRF